jgi:hypothetical protein
MSARDWLVLDCAGIGGISAEIRAVSGGGLSWLDR